MTCPPGFWHEAMRRAGYSCERCGGKRGLTLSHRLDAGSGGPFTWWNIDVLCMGPAATGNPGGWSGGGCHDWRHAEPEQAEQQGWRVSGEIRRGRYVGADAQYRALVDAAREGTSS